MAKKKGKRLPRPGETGRAEPAEAAPATPPGDSAEPQFPVVGIGASAGGLDAFRKLFSNMPAASGLAFVLIPHLDPTHESLMVGLLARSTTMPVVEAEEDMPVAADRVYVLPPNKYMTIGGGKLHLTGPVERAGLPTSIDIFLRSLAEDRQEQAIGIVLSGTGAHGTLGLKAIKANGGMAMVQDPGTAEYDGMPRSAIATGQADYILPPAQMPQALLRYVQHFAATSDPAAEAVEEVYLDQVLALLRTRAKLDFHCYRKKTLLRRAKRRMSLHHIDRIPEYLAFLQDHPEEVARLAKDLLISVTSFFRDREVFQELEGQVIPQLVRAKNADESLRVWVPGCATGEEAYSIAMLLIEQLVSAQKTCRLQIFATDVAEDALEVARRGCYPASITADVSAERLGRFFTPTDEHSYQVNEHLREAITFAAQNVLGDPPFSNLDLISCRNLLIYLEPDVQQKLLGIFHFALREVGYLLLGPSETVGPRDDQFEEVSKKWRVYRHIDSRRPERVNLPIPASGKRPGASRGVTDAAEAGPAGLSTEQLQTELRTTRGELRNTAGELEDSKEDLKVSNEELMSMNEELQAANEELETSKEEMQTLNEELSTANS
jgi:two-component system CheB/CheR fusion protein